VTGSGPSAARRYKDITGELNAAVERMKRADARRVHELGEALPGLQQELRGAVERGAAVERQAKALWEDALDQVWNENWKTPPKLPEHTENPRPGHVDYLRAVAEQRLAVLRESVRRRGLLGRGR
jgi:hypothetical protein